MTEQNTITVKTVCGGDIHEPALYPSAQYKGEKVYFCAAHCLKAFQTDPDRFMAGEIPHNLGEENAICDC